MLADPRSEALSTRFASQWLRLQDAEDNIPEPYLYPDFTGQLRDDLVRETQLLFGHLLREDRSLLELYTADYTFLNERLARHYGIPGITGSEFRRVDYPDEMRRGVLGHGSVLLLTSMSARTSPVLRGKWVMEVLMGTPPPPPPPNIPSFEDTAGAAEGRVLSTRERLELHASNPTCNACHRFMDPIGLALDNYDVTGRVRIRENGVALDTRGTYYDGTEVSMPRDLTDVLMKRPVPARPDLHGEPSRLRHRSADGVLRPACGPRHRRGGGGGRLPHLLLRHGRRAERSLRDVQSPAHPVDSQPGETDRWRTT